MERNGPCFRMAQTARKGGLTMRILKENAAEKKCQKCKWNNVFWAESGCARFNAGEPCKFEEKCKNGKEDA